MLHKKMKFDLSTQSGYHTDSPSTTSTCCVSGDRAPL